MGGKGADIQGWSVVNPWERGCGGSYGGGKKPGGG